MFNIMFDKLKNVIINITEQVKIRLNKPTEESLKTENSLKHIFWNIGWN